MSSSNPIQATSVEIEPLEHRLSEIDQAPNETERWVSHQEPDLDQTTDGWLKEIQQSIDASLSQDAKLQEFLTWGQQKAESVSTPYKPAAVRAFYLAHAHDQVLSSDFVPNLTLAIARDFNLNFAPALARDRALTRALARAHNLVYDLKLSSALDLDRELALALTRDRDLDAKLVQTLQHLKSQLPANFSEQGLEDFSTWWLTHGSTWTEALRQVMIEHRNIAHDWQFTADQEQALQKYYDANQFLVELLKQRSTVSKSVRQDIEDHLLLPS
jgi:predicted NACHT family NTPase